MADRLTVRTSAEGSARGQKLPTDGHGRRSLLRCCWCACSLLTLPSTAAVQGSATGSSAQGAPPSKRAAARSASALSRTHVGNAVAEEARSSAPASARTRVGDIAIASERERAVRESSTANDNDLLSAERSALCLRVKPSSPS